MPDLIEKPKGQSTMIVIAILTFIFLLVRHIAMLILILFTDLAQFREIHGPVYQFIFHFFEPVIIAYLSMILFKLIKKDVEGIYMIKILFPFMLFLTTLNIVEGYSVGFIHSNHLMGFVINSLVLLYWNNPSHIRYFRSLEKTS